MWKFKNDNTPAIINAKKHIASSHSNKIDKLPKTAILFFMRGGIEYTTKHYKTKKISNHFPRFLNSCPVCTADMEHLKQLIPLKLLPL